MLAGIGGRTIEEARERMPVEEVRIWQAYMAKNGPLAIQRRVEYTSAQIAMILANQNRGANKPAMGLKDFLLWSAQEGSDDDIEQALGELMKVSGRPKKGQPAKKLWARREAGP